MEEAATTVPEDDCVTLRGKMRGIGTDGAATVVGHHRGVVTRLKAIHHLLLVYTVLRIALI